MFTEKPMFPDFWTENQVVENTFISEPAKVDMDWLADSFLTEGGVAPGDLASYVTPGVLMVR